MNPQEIFLRSDDPYPTIGSVSDQNKTALVKALVISVTAPSQKLANECVQIGEAIATRLTKTEVEQCKQKAEELIAESEREIEEGAGQRQDDVEGGR